MRALFAVAVMTGLSCGSSFDETAVRSETQIELHVVVPEVQCQSDCVSIDFRSTAYRVDRKPALVLGAADIDAIFPVRLFGIDDGAPEASYWKASLMVTTEAKRQLDGIRAALDPEDQVAFLIDGQPLSVIYSSWLGPLVGVGEFSSRDELVSTLGTLAPIMDSSDEGIEVFSADERQRRAQTRALLEESDRMFQETERLHRLAEEGKITREEMIRRLGELGADEAQE